MNLKPCPFCGGVAEATLVKGIKYKRPAVVCKTCGASCFLEENRVLSYHKPSRLWSNHEYVEFVFGDRLEKLWNRRA